MLPVNTDWAVSHFHESGGTTAFIEAQKMRRMAFVAGGALFGLAVAWMAFKK